MSLWGKTMNAREKQLSFDSLPEGARKRLLEVLQGSVSIVAVGPSYDPELLYVECQICGKPVLWEKGRTTELLIAAGVDVSRLDERCMIVSEGCPSCDPYPREGYTLAVVRLAGLTPEEAIYMSRPGGTA